MSTVTRLTTADELYRMSNDGAGYELVRGVLKRKGDPHNMSPSGFKHGAIVARLTCSLAQYIDEKSLGEVTGAETGFKLSSDPDTVRAPDVGFVQSDRIPAGELTEKFWPGPPDLAVEVTSPSDSSSELDEKVDDYLSAGVRLIWVVNPMKRTVTVYQPNSQPLTLSEGDTLNGLDVLSGFQYSVAKLFAGKR